MSKTDDCYKSFDLYKAIELLQQRGNPLSNDCVVWYLGAYVPSAGARCMSPMMWPDSYTPTIPNFASELHALVMTCIRDLLDEHPDAINFEWIGPHVWPSKFVQQTMKGPSDE